MRKGKAQKQGGRGKSASVWTNLLVRQEFSILLFMLIVYVAVGLVQPRWFSFKVLTTMLLYTPYIMLAALGEMVVIINRGVDMSIGAVMGFSGIITGMIFRDHPQFNLVLACLLAMAIGTGLGLINGLLINRFRLPSIIATMGSGYVYRGIFYIICAGKQIDNTAIPRYITSYSAAKHSAIGIPYLVVFAFLIAILVGLAMRHTRLGRNIYACGNNPKAAILRGINLKGISYLCYGFSGLCAGLAAMAYISRIGYVNPTAIGTGIEFTIIAAVVIGGTSMSGGTGGVFGTVLGVLLLAELNTAITIVGLSGRWQQTIYGLVIILAVLLDKLFRSLMTKRLEVEST